jgi:leader peptidase (prepilin peptidase)/N-methyltransferase
MLPGISIIFGFCFGAAFGSFLNVVIYRLPRGMSLSEPPSHCPSCGHRLGALDLVPLFSFLAAGTKCRYCKAPIGWRYFGVELLTAIAWSVFWWQNLVVGSDTVRFVALAAFATTLIACIFIDLYHYIIPDALNAILLSIGLAYNAWLLTQGRGWTFVGGVGLPSAIVGALVGIGVLWGIAFLGRVIFHKDAMGHGDIKLARGIGAVLFAGPALMSFGVAIMVGAVLGVVQILARGKGEEEQEEEDGEAGDESESIGSLVKAGIGYVLLVDVVALFVPIVERKWFGEAAGEVEEEDDWKPGFTTIPFGPYLALGALLVAMFGPTFFAWLNAYWNWATKR